MTLPIIIFGFAGLIWGALALLRGSILTGCFLYLVAACCLANRFFSFDAAGLTWSLDRFLLMGLCAAFFVQWRLGWMDIKSHSPLEALLLVFFALLLVSTLTHDWRGHGDESGSVLMHLVNGYLIPITLFFLARNALLDESQLRRGYLLLALFGIYLSVTAILEISGLWSLVFPRYIADPEQGIHFGRARGPMVQAARLGLYLIACLAATWSLLFWRASWGRSGRLVAVLLVPLYASAMFLTYTRSVWLGMVLSTLLLVGLTLRGRLRLAILGGMCTAMLLVVAAKSDQLIAFKREHTAAETRDSTYMRARFMYVSLQMFKDRPLFGFGFGQFQNANQTYLADRTTPMRLESIRGYINHNTLLSLLVEVGIFGLALFLLINICLLRDAWRLWQLPDGPPWMRGQGLLLLLAYPPYAVQMMFREVSYSPEENALVFLLAGITSGLLAMQARSTGRATSTGVVEHCEPTCNRLLNRKRKGARDV